MPTRTQFLSGLTSLTEGGTCEECAICIEGFDCPVALPCKHIFCEGCIVEWLSRRQKNSCPTCRCVLFDIGGNTDRSPLGTNRLQIVAQALEYSGLATGDGFATYSDENSYTDSVIQRAAAAAHRYLIEENHTPVTGPVLVDMRTLGPDLIAMGNLLRGYAQAAGRPYSGYQRRDWKLIVGHLLRHLDQANGQVREGDSVIGMAHEYGVRVRNSLQGEMVDLHSGRFFESGAHVQSPSGDLDVLLNYVVFRCAKVYQNREAQRTALRQAQKEALDRESTRFGRVMRKAAQNIFGSV